MHIALGPTDYFFFYRLQRGKVCIRKMGGSLLLMRAK